MKNFLRKIKLFTEFRTELNIFQHDFAQYLAQVVDYGEIGGFANIMDIFAHSPNKYKGVTAFEGFSKNLPITHRILLMLLLFGTQRFGVYSS